MDIDNLSFGGLTFPGLDSSMNTANTAASATTDEDGEWTRVVLEGTGSLEIAFDARRSKDGSVRVRMSPTSASSALGPSSTEDVSSPDSTSSTTPSDASLPSPLEPTQAPTASALSKAYADVLARARDPFLGVGSADDATSMLVDNDVSWLSGLSVPSDPGAGSSLSANNSAKKRVRIALARAPDAISGEGGEWVIEVQ